MGGMDILDQPTHTLILTDLAANLAQEAAAGTLQKDDFAALGVAATTSDADGRLTTSSIRSYLAQARFAAATADAVRGEASEQATEYLGEVLGELEHLASRLPNARFEDGLQLPQQWPVPDELTYTLTEALLKIASAVPAASTRALAALSTYARALTQSVLSAQATTPSLAISGVPQLHGLARALQDVPYAWTRETYAPFLATFTAVATSTELGRVDALLVVLPEQHEAAAQCALPRAPSASGGRDDERSGYAELVLQHYAMLGFPLSGRLVAWCALNAVASLLAQALACTAQAYAPAWKALQRAPPAVKTGAESDAAAAAQGVYERTAALVAQLTAAVPRLHVELYARELLSTALKVTVLCVAAYDSTAIGTFVPNTLGALLGEEAVLYDDLLQRAALESVAVLAHVRPALAPTLAPTLRRFVQQPLPLLEADLASGALAVCVQREGGDAASSLTYALLNHVARDAELAERAAPQHHVRGVRPASSAQAIVVGNTVAVITALAKALDDVHYTVLAISLLLQRLQGPTRHAPTSLLTQLVPLALAAPTSSFVNVMDYLSDAVRAALKRRDAAALGAVHTAQELLARGLTADAERRGQAADEAIGERTVRRKDVYLEELLALFAEAGSQRNVAGVRGGLPVLAALLAHRDLNPQWAPTTEQVYLFRNLWTVIGASGAATPLTAPMPPNEPLSVIALKTPVLIPASVVNYVEEDIEVNSILKQDTHGASLDTVRRTVAPVLGTRLLEGGKASGAKLAFLHAVLEVEWRRAAAGRPSMMLFYFAHHGVAASSLSAPLQAIADRVFATFLVHVSQRAEAHAVGPYVYEELRNLLVGACHRDALVRQYAHAYLERLVSAFPELFARSDVVVTMLELLTLLARSCDGEVEDAYWPQYRFTSPLAGVTLELTDAYAERKRILVQVYDTTRNILTRVQSEMPQELSHVLLRYLRHVEPVLSPGTDGLGKTVAMDYARGLPPSDPAALSPVRHDASGLLTRDLAAQSAYAGEVAVLGGNTAEHAAVLAVQLAALLHAAEHGEPVPLDTLRTTVYRTAACILHTEPLDFDLVHYLVAIPMTLCTKDALALATQAWAWVMGERPDAETALVSEIASGWARTIHARQGIYSPALVARDALLRKTDMSSFDRAEITAESEQADALFTGHLLVLQLLSDRLQASRSSNAALVTQLATLVQRQAEAAPLLSTHPLMRSTYLALVLFGLRVLSYSHLDALVEVRLRDGVCRLALHWFATRPHWSYGGNLKRANAELQYTRDVQLALRTATLRADSLVSSATVAQPGTPVVHSAQPLTPACTLAQAVRHVQTLLTLLHALLQHEESLLDVWLHPTREAPPRAAPLTLDTLHTAWSVDAAVAVQVARRSHAKELEAELGRLVRAAPHRAVACPGALAGLIAERGSLATKQGTNLKWLHVWAPVMPVNAIELLQPGVGGHPLVLQYAMRVLEEHPTDLVFFYIPQLVQALRDDTYGYVAQFILKTSVISQLFCHQILWNMDANKYKDDNAEVPDPLKPALDAMGERIVAQLSGTAKDFYEREFAFFNEVTSISGKLKPFIKKSKPEKKAKIDEEMAQIRVDPGVYLPSNPDGVVVDLNRTSGRPLQSHAKAPFMATFLVRRPDGIKVDAEGQQVYHDVWQSAIFKVGDDCRQDVLALQVIAQFKNIFMAIGLDVYLDPYRVTATAPGCGVIDVVPNATSRDEMGRQKINDLVDFFHTRFGAADTVSFQRARLNFIQSMAAYSVVCHILQIRDRHNGNIMIDGQGHLVHIDFGFLFDIGPGGMRFEPYSFKLSLEMVNVMGGPDSPGFRLFEQLVVKAFLAVRPYVDEIVGTCALMLGTDLPSFKGPSTFDRLRDRFKPHLSDRDAAKHAMWLVKDAYGNRRAVLYDMLQEKQNHIPYRK
ncbi:1-phosphatidylinositol 4-kinase [Malassezia obtusa]|uniref:1-phosphatidylinositol 4-kinase n=1 Tax=Malassezia obtusa TaxID=76774 RepID=A0AAF0ISY9_9BASI|nr:1-phosphatidylinositol 4-kinase [Malassezia obtusa]